MFQISEKMCLHFAWKGGRVEEWKMSDNHPPFQSSILPLPKRVKRFLKHARFQWNQDFMEIVGPMVTVAAAIASLL